MNLTSDVTNAAQYVTYNLNACFDSFYPLLLDSDSSEDELFEDARDEFDSS